MGERVKVSVQSLGGDGHLETHGDTGKGVRQKRGLCQIMCGSLVVFAFFYLLSFFWCFLGFSPSTEEVSADEGGGGGDHVTKN